MIEYVIGIGDTSSFRYIGIKPPLDEVTTEAIAEQLILPDWVDHNYIYRYRQAPINDPEYTELGFDVGDALDWLGVTAVNQGTVRAAEQVAALLRVKGDIVTILDGIYPTDFQTPIFGGDWVEMGEVAMLLQSRCEE